MNIDKYMMILEWNEDNYENRVDVENQEELIENMANYYDACGYFEEVDSLDIDDFEHEIDFINESDKERRKHIENLIEWKGKGEYCLVGHAWGSPMIMSVAECFECELDNIDNFPIPLSVGLFENTEECIKRWKEEQDAKYIYFITFVCHVGVPWYRVEYVVYSDEELSENTVYQRIYDEREIFIGEFNTLGSNYFIQEVENFDTSNFDRYNLRNDYEIITLS